MSPYYPPANHRIEVCANCHAVRDNPAHKAPPKCCKAPHLYTYERVEGVFPKVYAPAAPQNPSQLEMRDTEPHAKVGGSGE